MCSIGGCSHTIQSYLNHFFLRIKSFFISASAILIAASWTRQIWVNTRNQERLYRISLRTVIWGKYRFRGWKFWRKWLSTQEKSRDEKNIFYKLYNRPRQRPDTAQKSSHVFLRPWGPKTLQKSMPFPCSCLVFLKLVILGFPCQNFIHSSRHAYRYGSEGERGPIGIAFVDQSQTKRAVADRMVRISG